MRQARGLQLGLGVVGLLLALSGCTGQTATVSQVTIVNRTAYNVDVAATNAAREEFLPLATVPHHSQTTVGDVLDQGSTWVFRFEVSARPMGEIQLTRRGLAAAGWRVAVPPVVQQRAQAAGIPPPPP